MVSSGCDKDAQSLLSDQWKHTLSLSTRPIHAHQVSKSNFDRVFEDSETSPTAVLWGTYLIFYVVSLLEFDWLSCLSVFVSVCALVVGIHFSVGLSVGCIVMSVEVF